MGYRAASALLLFCVLLVPCLAHAAAKGSHPKVIVVVANRLLLSDLDDPKLPTISKMLREGAVGLVSPNCVWPKTEYSVLLTANAGSPCRGGAYVKEFYDFNEVLLDGTNAGDSFGVRTGHRARPWTAVFLGIGQALQDEAKLDPAPARIGALGDAVHAAGLSTCVIGNADLGLGVVDRAAAVLAMDSRGIVDAGRLSPLNALYSTEGEATGLRSPPSWTGDRVAEGWHSLPPRVSEDRRPAGVSVVYFGASTQLDEMKPSISDSAYAAHRSEMLRQLDFVLRGLMAKTGTQRATLMLVSFSPPKGPSWDQLTPIVVYPTPRPGLLGSPTTRTNGLIAASDFAPTVLRLMHVLQSEDMIGRAVEVAPDAHAVEKLRDMGARVTANERLLLPVCVGLAVVGVLAFTGAALVIAFGLKASRRVIALLKTGLVAGACAPAALLLAVLAPAGMAGYLAGTAVSLIVLTTLCMLVGRATRRAGMRSAPVVVAYAITCVIILVDAVTGCYLCKFSGPSSYQITGMRFYGIGNEYAGVLIAMAALATLSLRSEVGGRKSERIGQGLCVLAIGAVVVLSLGFGSLGANYGGTAAAVVTFGLLWIAVRKGGFGARHVVIAFAAAVAAVALFALLDWKLAGAAGSHAARATGLAEKLGGGYLVSLALRKVMFNLQTTFSVKGISVTLGFVPFLALWFWGVQGKVREVFKQDGRVMAGVNAVMVGALAAYMLNDSGIVFAAIMIAMTVLVLLYSVLEEVEPCRG